MMKKLSIVCTLLFALLLPLLLISSDNKTAVANTMPRIATPEAIVPQANQARQETQGYGSVVYQYDNIREPGNRFANALTVPATVYGVNFMSSAEYPSTPGRYAKAKSTGAQWNRWPMYWHSIEQTSDIYDWSAHDAVVIDDIENGLLINMILMGIPGFYYSGSDAVPNTLNEPIFSDGTDTPGVGKTININNKWARYVHAAVNRYKPGGTIAQQRGWAAGAGVTHWEMWNEPDLDWFWDGTKTEYARLLKVGYHAAQTAHPDSQIIFGSMANNYNDLSYYKDVLTILDSDPTAEQYRFFHDVMATHSYFNAWQSWFHVYRTRLAMHSFGWEKPIWLNETGIPAWDDYPGPVWDSQAEYRGTQTEQADYMIQTAFYALFAGADAIFHFQLFDGCGNQPQGTDFPPHNSELCNSAGNLISDPSKPCGGDANGLFRNETDAACFTQHPNPGTPRENFEAYKILTQYLQDVEPLNRDKVCTVNGQSWISFYRPNTNQRIMAVWACKNQDELAAIPAIDSGALLLKPDGSSQFIAPTNGNYYLTLPAATNDNPVSDPAKYPVGGRPFILVERDTQGPSVSIDATQSGSSANVSWSGDDNGGSGITTYSVQVSVDGGPLVVWLSNVTTTSAVYTGIFNYGVEFVVTATDRGGNVSQQASDLIGTLPPTNPPTVSKSVSTASALPNDTLTYQIRVRNSASSTNPNVSVSDFLPSTLTYVTGSLSASAGTATYNNGSITWNGSLTANQTLTIGFRATVKSGVSNGTTVVNNVTVSDGFGANESASASTLVDLATATPTATPPPATATPTPVPTIPPNFTHRTYLPIVMK